MRHSDLIDPADLHFSKFKTFAGLTSAVTPDFADQIFAATDTNKIYRSTGTALGNLIELAPQEQNGGTGGEGGTNYTLVTTFSGSLSSVTPDFINQLFAATDTNKIYRATGTEQGNLIELSPSPSAQQILTTGNQYPFNFPEFVGQQYLDTGTGLLFFAKGLSPLDWRPVYEELQIDITISNSTGQSSMTFDLWYSPEEPTDGFNFTNQVATGLQSSTNYLTNAIQKAGIGFYAITPTFADPTVITRSSTSYIEHPIDTRQIFSTQNLTGTFTANGQAISSEVLHFAQFPKTGTLSDSPYPISFEANLI
jgi:hypothetical protein